MTKKYISYDKVLKQQKSFNRAVAKGFKIDTRKGLIRIIAGVGLISLSFIIPDLSLSYY